MPTKKSIYDRALRRWFPKRYIRMMMTRLTLEYHEKRKAAKSKDDRWEIERDHDFAMEEWDDWLRSIDDRELVNKAARMDLSLDDFLIPESNRVEPKFGHWYESKFGSRILERDSRRALQKAIRERVPTYRKERRELYEFYLKIIFGVGTAITGIGGTIIGIISILKK
jgi:hypothetical protein